MGYGKGTLKAKAEGIAETEVSPIKVEEGKEVTFTAEATHGYKIKGWTLDGLIVHEAGIDTECKLTVKTHSSVKVFFETISESKAILTLDATKLTINVKAITPDGKPITLEGCTETTLASGKKTELHANGTTVTLKGNIIELYCNENKLTALNVQGCTALKKLDCTKNKLEPKAMTELLNALPARVVSDDAEAKLYTEMSIENEGNCKDYTKPEDLKKAFEGAMGRNWKLQKEKANGSWVDI